MHHACYLFGSDNSTNLFSAERAIILNKLNFFGGEEEYGCHVGPFRSHWSNMVKRTTISSRTKDEFAQTISALTTNS